MKLKILRKKIDVVDAKIMELLSLRFALSRETGKEKRIQNLPISDSEREKEILVRIKHISSELSIPERFATDMFRKIISFSKNQQKKL